MNPQKSAKIQAQEKMAEALFEYAAACHIENILQETSKHDGSEVDFAPTPQLQTKMNKLMVSNKRKELLTTIKRSTVKVLPKVAIILLIIGSSLAIAVGSVDALRIKVFNTFLEVKEQFTSIQLKENNLHSEPVSQIMPSDWDGYVLAYVPSGFKIIRTEKDGVTKIIEYGNESGQMIRFTQYDNIKTDLRIDTENAIVQSVNIHNCKALLAEKQGISSIVWQEQKLFYLMGEIDKSEIIRMADSLQKK